MNNFEIYEKINFRKRELAQQQNILAALLRRGELQFKIEHCQKAINNLKNKINFLQSQYKI